VSPPTRVHEETAQAVRCRWHEHSNHGGHQVVDQTVACLLRAELRVCVRASFGGK
jgi:hypothetical protein